MTFSASLALAALSAAQAAAPQTAPEVKWVPLQSTKRAKAQQPQAPSPTTAPAASQPVTSSEPTNAPTAQPPAASVQVVPPRGVETPATPTTGHNRIVLWRNIESGMTVAQLRSLYPQGPNVTYKADRTVLSDVPILEGCEAKVNIMHPAGVVKEIVMRGEGSLAGRCSLKIITALSGKYGQPLEKDKVRGSLLARQGKNYVWSRDGIALQFKRYTSGALGGGGLFAASWELRYSANATNIDL